MNQKRERGQPPHPSTHAPHAAVSPFIMVSPPCLSEPEARGGMVNGKNSVEVKKNVLCISHYKHDDSIRLQRKRCVRSI